MAKADQPLIQQLEELQAWLQTLDPARYGRAPSWSHVLLAEDSDVPWTTAGDTRPTLSRQSLRTPTEFGSRWLELVAEGRRDWINLSAHGVWKDSLVVLIEAPRHGVKGSFRPEQIFVVFSGPPIEAGWDLSRHLLIA